MTKRELELENARLRGKVAALEEILAARANRLPGLVDIPQTGTIRLKANA